MNTSPYVPLMEKALALAEQGRWSTCPNPTVGALLVRDGHIVAEGWHKEYGGPHAEIECLRDARDKGIAPTGCTMVVTLEPCNHQGKTPPCTESLIASGISKVVVGLRDPNPQATGGIEKLRACGIEVEENVAAELCRDAIADFIVWQNTTRPFVIVKMASTLDGRIATRTGQSQWISGEESRAMVHALRSGVGRSGGTVLIGGGTYRADNPKLTVRTDTAVARHPLACILTSRLPSPAADSYLLRQRPHDTIFLASPAAAASPTALALRETGVRVWSVPPENVTTPRLNGYGPDLTEILCRIRQELGCPYVLCEGGGTMALSLLARNLVDIFYLHISPTILGDNEARPLFNGRSPMTMSEALRLRTTQIAMCGQDVHMTLRPLE